MCFCENRKILCILLTLFGKTDAVFPESSVEGEMGGKMKQSRHPETAPQDQFSK